MTRACPSFDQLTADPPGRVGRELEPASRVEPLDRRHKAAGPLPDKVVVRYPAPVQSRDLVESDRFGRNVRSYAVDRTALVLEPLADRRATGRAHRGATWASSAQVKSRARDVIVQPHDPACCFCFPMNGVGRPTQPQALARDDVQASRAPEVTLVLRPGEARVSRAVDHTLGARPTQQSQALSGDARIRALRKPGRLVLPTPSPRRVPMQSAGTGSGAWRF
jgi:hypothetical protein